MTVVNTLQETLVRLVHRVSTASSNISLALSVCLHDINGTYDLLYTGLPLNVSTTTNSFDGLFTCPPVNRQCTIKTTPATNVN